ncbi:hypothetical protein [Methylobacterium nodulans]|uniref:Uncharacterized protein n=1 Tax=Methylobacterium nodulans (strain LMG 21967 / CNCM I-2342 / ORS 2060) TaxID=460265 RepID=B8ILS2_METNO|nr:hypothetical protein [Methylobacterium nodulans]ACL62047.1 hypothetical protein Mnod_7308 [Methylobacterium nodulans ORS 2060]
MTQSTADPAGGAIILPKRASLWAVGAVLASAAAQLVWAGSYAAKIESRLEDLSASDTRILTRLDERYATVSGRVESLERDRDRLVRLEEQVRIATDLLREIRQEIRAPPRR